MDEEVRTLLKYWGVSQLIIDRFKENQIQIKHLTKITEFTLERLIPIAGERIDFMEHLEQYKDKQSQKVIQQPTIPLPMKNIETACIKNKESENSKNYPKKSSITASDHNTADARLKTSLPSLQDELSSPSTSKQSSEKDLCDPPAKRLCVKNNAYDLLALLKSSTSGKMVLGYFNMNACLNNNMRTVLADKIINSELSSNIYARMPTERVEFLTKEIIELFPSEIEAIWKGAYGGKHRRETSAGRGMLVQRYYSIRRKLRKCGILTKESSTYTVEECVASDVEFDDDIADNIQWLKNNSKPWVKVLELWEITNKNRLQSLTKNSIAVHDYMDSFPALKSANGYLLLEQDFNKMYPKSAMKLYAELPMLMAFIKKNIPNEKEKLCIDDSLTTDGKKIRTLLALNSLFSVVTACKKKKEQWRPSRQESREAFLLFVKTTNDIQSTLNLRKEKYLKYGLNLGVQAVIVGTDLDCIKYSYIVINEIYYEVETPFKAIDIAFKAMHALDSKYPTECAREWLFLQQGVYEIMTPHDKKIDAKVLVLIEEYLKFKSLQS